MNSKLSATTAASSTGRQYHIDCAPGDLAEYILLVGDPDRAQRAAQHFDEVRTERKHREFVTITGTYKGVALSVLAHGIGMDNIEIAVIEACQVTEEPTFIRCGTCSALTKELRLEDLVLSTGAVRLGNTESYFVDSGYPAVAHSDVLLALARAGSEQMLPFHVGLTATAPGFYGSQGREIPGFPPRFPNLPEDLGRMNVMNLEMESATLFVLASLRGLRAGTVCAVIGNRPRDEFADEKTRARAEEKCIKTSLAAFPILKKMDAQRKKRGLPLWLPE